ncbi:MAG: hypothetical protein CMJ46_15355 [Planctomyces sp.]|nr:hypothetical protein [Planctomyces sp.]
MNGENLSDGSLRITSGAEAPETVSMSSELTDSSLDAIFKVIPLAQVEQITREAECRDALNRLRSVEEVRRRCSQLQKASPVLSGTIGAYEVLELLGHGGMGEVYKVRHRHLDNLQVIKVLHHHRIHDSRIVDRFRQEMRVIGKLDHPNIVSAHHADEHDGLPYLVMDYVDGPTLAQILSEHRRNLRSIPVKNACEWMRQAALAVQYAHDRGVIHRDIKPDNLILDRRGHVKLLDLGLARIMNSLGDSDEENRLTGEFQVLGTPDYMSPEQMQVNGAIDEKVDIYAIGATLHALLSGQPPFYKSGEQNIVTKALRITTEPAPELRGIRDDVPVVLSDLVRRCLAKHPAERPGSADELAKELERWAEPETVLGLIEHDSSHTPVDPETQNPIPEVTPASGVKPPRKRRLTVLAGMAGFFLLALLVVRLNLPDGGELIVECDDPNARLELAAVQDQRSHKFELAQQPDSSYQLSTGTWNISISGVDADKYELTDDQITILNEGQSKVRIVRRRGQAEVTKREQNPLEVASETERELATLQNEIQDAKIPKDEELLKKFRSAEWRPGADSQLPGYATYPHGWNSTDFHWQVLPRFPHVSPYFTLSPRGTYVAAYHDITYDPYVRMLDRRTGRLTGVFHHGGRYARLIDWSPDETKLAICYWDWRKNGLAIVEHDGTIISEIKLPDSVDNTFTPFWSPDGSRVLILNSEKVLMLSAEGTAIAGFTPPDHGSRLFSHLWNQVWSPDGAMFAVPHEGSIKIYGKEGGQIQYEFKEENGLALNQCVWHPDGRRILTNARPADGERSACRLWTLTGESVHIGFAEGGEVPTGFSPDGKYLITNCGNVVSMSGHTGAKLDFGKLAGVYRDGMQVYWPEQDRIIAVSRAMGAGYSAEFSGEGKLLEEFIYPQPLTQFAFSWADDRNELYSIGSFDDNPGRLNAANASSSRLFVWSLEQENDRSINLEQNICGPVAFQPAGDAFTGYAGDGYLKQFSFEGTSKSIAHSLPGMCASWSHDSLKLATTAPYWNSDNVITIHSGDEEVSLLPARKGGVLGLGWSSDDRYLLSWDSEGEISVWNLKKPDAPIFSTTGEGFQLKRGNYHLSMNRANVCWHPSENVLAIPVTEGTWLYEVESGTETRIRHEAEGRGIITWLPDGEHLLIGKQLFHRSGNPVAELDIPEWDNLVHDVCWMGGLPVLKTYHHVHFYNEAHERIDLIRLPTFFNNVSPVSMPMRGLNAEHTSPDQHYFAAPLSIRSNGTQSQASGDINMIDLKHRDHLWAGIGFSDGTQVRIGPTGQLLSFPDKTDDYAAYVQHYGTGHPVVLTEMEFASRVYASAAQRALLKVTDLDGRISFFSEQGETALVELRDARDLPPLEEITNIDISRNPYLQDNDLRFLSELPALSTLNLAESRITHAGLQFLEKCERLTSLNLASLAIEDSLIDVLPPGLEELDVSHTNVGGYFLHELSRLTSLKRLNLSGINATTADVALLRSMLPDCDITWEEAAE